MTPPAIAHALIAAAAPPGDYECIAGDLHEEYIRRVRSQGVASANRWYWTQALLSVPPLLSYSRVRVSSWNLLAGGFIVALALIALLLATEMLNDALYRACRTAACAHSLYFPIDWILAGVFGAIIALLVRSGGVRFVLWSALALVAAIVIPTLLGYSSRLPLNEWLLLFGAVPAMGMGAALYHLCRRRQKD